ncbi:MAG: DUF881 domain-containing protein [Angustibacter sp.]
MPTPSREPPPSRKATERKATERKATERKATEQIAADPRVPPDADRPGAWRLLLAAARPRASRAQVLGAVLVGALGFGIVAQLTQDESQRLAGLRQTDLVQILDDLGERRDRLAAEQSDLEAEQRKLATGASGSQEAVDAARSRLDSLAVLAGTAAATGPGVEVSLTDPQGTIRAPQILDLVQELRDAGAEAIQVGSARVVATTAFSDTEGGVGVDGVLQRPPYTVLAIGDGQTMATALEIPGGVIASLPAGARGQTATKTQLRITALRPVPRPRYARPATPAAPSP